MNITPVFKKGEKESENNYRSVSILSNVLKVFEKCTFRHIRLYGILLIKISVRIRKGYST